MILNYKTAIFFFLVFGSLAANGQDFNVENQYSQAMENAKTAFNAEQYSQAVMFYREAIGLKPEALLPKYKIEDIRTIYIKNELDSLIIEHTQPTVNKPKNQKKKDIEAQQIILAEQAEVLATEKMYREADIAKQELEEISKQVEVLDIVDTTLLIDEETISEIEPNRESGLQLMENRSISTVGGGTVNSSSQLTVNPKVIPIKSIIDKPIDTVVVEVKPKPAITPTVNTTKPISTTPIVKDENWVKEETKRLVQKYPNKKTVEDIEKPGKKITRVIMNIDSKVTTYLKVVHSWGATYYFVDEVGLELRSISQTHFNLMTDLSTYKSN